MLNNENLDQLILRHEIIQPSHSSHLGQYKQNLNNRFIILATLNIKHHYLMEKSFF